jgi:hypothetical protein
MKIIGAIHVTAGSWMPIIQLTENVFVFQGHTDLHIYRSSSRKRELPILSKFTQITQAGSNFAGS